MAELQRSDPLSLSKFMHLPVSVGGAFLINYLSSLVRLSLIIFVPIMSGFCLALVYTKGIVMLPVLAALAAFMLMITALTYQVQGWLALLMNNPRRRRTVIVVSTALLILFAQLPNLVNLVSWKVRDRTCRTHESCRRNWRSSIAVPKPGNSMPRNSRVALKRSHERTSSTDYNP